MDFMFTVLGFGFALLGIGGLLGVSLLPATKTVWPYNTRLFLGKLPDSPRNRSIISIWLIGAGLYMALSASLQGTAKDVALASFTVLTILYLLVRQPDKAGS